MSQSNNRNQKLKLSIVQSSVTALTFLFPVWLQPVIRNEGIVFFYETDLFPNLILHLTPHENYYYI
jgi:hypothetical protein